MHTEASIDPRTPQPVAEQRPSRTIRRLSRREVREMNQRRRARRARQIAKLLATSTPDLASKFLRGTRHDFGRDLTTDEMEKIAAKMIELSAELHGRAVAIVEAAKNPVRFPCPGCSAKGRVGRGKKALSWICTTTCPTRRTREKNAREGIQ